MIDWKNLRLQLMAEMGTPVLPPNLEIPKLPQTVSSICQKANSPECTAGELAEILERDAAISVDLLKHVNSAATGLRTRAATVRQAVALLGVSNTRLFVITTVLEQHMRNTKSPLILAQLFCLSAMERSLLAREIAKSTHRDTDLAFASALIQDFIVPSLTRQHVGQYGAFMKQLSTGTDELVELEMAAFGWNHADCAASLMMHWGFPDDLICCTLLHHRPEQIWGMPLLRNTACPAVAVTSWLPSVLAPSTAHMARLCRYLTDNFRLDVATVAQSVEEQLRVVMPNLQSYVTLRQHLENAAADVPPMSAGSDTVPSAIDRRHVETTIAAPTVTAPTVTAPTVAAPTDGNGAGKTNLPSGGVCVTAERIEPSRNRDVQQTRIETGCAPSVVSEARAPAKPVAGPRYVAKRVDKAPPPISRAAATATISDALSQEIAEVRSAQSGRLNKVYDLLKNHGSISAQVLDEMSQQSIDQLAVDLDLLVKSSLEPQVDEAPADHCVRLAQLAVCVGAVAGHTREELRWLSMGCLVSRLGVTHAARQLIEEPRKLNPIEFAEIKKAPGRVFEMLSKIRFPWIARTVAYQIHERWNGSGYPRGKMGMQIHSLSRIAAVCDVYVSLTSPRAHRPPFSLFEAVKQILADTSLGLFAPDTVRAFFRTISLFPIGAYVRLNTGQLARVARTNPDMYDRPSIEIIGESSPQLVSLAETPDLRVIEVIDASQAAEEVFVPQQDQLKREEIKALLGSPGKT